MQPDVEGDFEGDQDDEEGHGRAELHHGGAGGEDGQVKKDDSLVGLVHELGHGSRGVFLAPEVVLHEGYAVAEEEGAKGPCHSGRAALPELADHGDEQLRENERAGPTVRGEKKMRSGAELEEDEEK